MNRARIAACSSICLLSAGLVCQAQQVRATGVITNPTFATRLGQSVQGATPGVNTPLRGIFFGSPFFSGFPYGYAPPLTSPTYVQQTNAPVVVIQTAQPEQSAQPSPQDDPVKVFGAPAKVADPDPVPATAQPTSKPSSTYQPPMFLIALKDQTISTAIAYWVDGDQLRYVTPDRKQKQVALDKVDAALSTRLNDERNIPFQVPSR